MLYYNLSKVCGNVQCICNYSMNSHFKNKQYLIAFGNTIFSSCWALSNTRKLCVRLIPVTKHSEIYKYIRSEMFFVNFLTTQQSTLDSGLWLPFPLHNLDLSSLLKQVPAALEFQRKEKQELTKPSIKEVVERFSFL